MLWNSVGIFITGLILDLDRCVYWETSLLLKIGFKLSFRNLESYMCFLTIAVPGVSTLTEICPLDKFDSSSLCLVSTKSGGLDLFWDFSRFLGLQKSTRLRLETREWHCFYKPRHAAVSLALSIFGLTICVKFLVNFKHALISNFSFLLFWNSLFLVG